MHSMNERRERRDRARRPADPERREAPPTWRNTQPRGNPATDTRDLARSIERFESLLGR
jgi:hypothetical protein